MPDVNPWLPSNAPDSLQQAILAALTSRAPVAPTPAPGPLLPEPSAVPNPKNPRDNPSFIRPPLGGQSGNEAQVSGAQAPGRAKDKFSGVAEPNFGNIAAAIGNALGVTNPIGMAARTALGALTGMDLGGLDTSIGMGPAEISAKAKSVGLDFESMVAKNIAQGMFPDMARQAAARAVAGATLGLAGNVSRVGATTAERDRAYGPGYSAADIGRALGGTSRSYGGGGPAPAGGGGYQGGGPTGGY